MVQHRGAVNRHEPVRRVGEVEGGRVGKEAGARAWQSQDVATIHVDPTHLFDGHCIVAGSVDGVEQLFAVRVVLMNCELDGKDRLPRTPQETR